ncbi:hypothetical protein ANN_16105 [Periplaneta americana]|uniref:Dehydrogenase/reductase SDR family member 11 n=1 Tax=Periplaneta americana TaxID=6978 RepID=A0ABQ8SIH5_PERAM|nr:hypothetical protein ANN_16105 [Periplaneta americana]
MLSDRLLELNDSCEQYGMKRNAELYGTKTWTLRRREEKRLETFEMWIWRKMERVKWTDRIRNEAVWERRWQGRVAVVTGASAGIGAEIAKDLVKHGMKVVGIARRVERVEELKKELKGASGTLYPLQADVSKEEDVATAFKWVKDNLKGVDVLINNAGVASCSSLSEGPVKNWRTIMELNVLGLSMCTKEAIQSMKERGVDDGHIIHINRKFYYGYDDGILKISRQLVFFPPLYKGFRDGASRSEEETGHGVPHNSEDLGIIFYSASKNAVTALTEGLRRELVLNKSRIKVTVSKFIALLCLIYQLG